MWALAPCVNRKLCAGQKAKPMLIGGSGSTQAGHGGPDNAGGMKWTYKGSRALLWGFHAPLQPFILPCPEIYSLLL